MDCSKEKTRKEKRKESRLHKRQKQFTSWLGHQISKREKAQRKKRQLLDSKPNSKGIVVEKKHMGRNGISENAFLGNKTVKKVERRPKSKFHEYLKMEMTKGVISAEEDLEMERRLEKKLKLKKRKLGGLNDVLNVLIEGMPSELGSKFDDFSVSEDDYDHYGPKIKIGEEKHEELSAKDDVDKSEKEVKSVAKDKKQKLIKSSEAFVKHLEEHCFDDKTIDSAEYNDGSNVKEPSNEELKPDVSMNSTAHHLRAGTRCESEEYAHIRRRVRGLLNKISESNLESIAGEVATIFQSVTRNVCSQIIGMEIVASCVMGPRGNEQHAAVFAAFVAGMACYVGIDFSAKLLASIARSFEDEYHKADSLSLRNISLLLCHLYIFGVCASDLVFDLLDVLNKRLTELDVSTILTILQCCGMKLRGDDPTSMKYFVVTIQNRVNEMKSDSKCIKEGEPKINSKRMEFMLETICDIKNNKKRSKEDPAHHMRIKKWLQKLHIEDVLLRGLTWSKLLDPEKKGQWWYSGEINSTTVNFEEVTTTSNKDVQEAKKLVQLAASQRMNTDVRRAIFCIIMSGEDYLDAFEKILRLDLSGKQDREIMRVLLDCCLQEKVFNKYYTVLASKFCSHDKNHKFTLQYCIWDNLKEIDSMEMIRLMNLARFISEMLSSFSLSLALLKTVDLMNPSQLTPRRIMHFRMLFEALFENTDALVWNIFSRVSAAPELETLRTGLVFFLGHHVVTANSEKTVAHKFRIAKKALGNAAGVLM
ncbi:nucleolar MIF4G domain-containing protein 1 isoform X2 [Phalaenopsis equestris]|uniref:nucleolar MIF4G domain-containing protein 1 isoform X2 n=1 Tax=Phalaenopsis equestris TaxID=78828 RepID=UPI0009E5A22B|nr:nucleolar MIF4G domain-containing protein 1 isoform X2 [Phalaenopsis equestris]